MGSSTRSTLHALSRLAQKHNLALLLTSRLTKKLPALDPLSLHRSIGSLAFASTARSVLLLTPAPPHLAPGDSPGAYCAVPPSQPSVPTPTHLLLTLKSNLASPPAPFPYTLADTITWHPELQTQLPTPKPEKPIDPDSALAAAITFLQTLLGDGPVKATRIHTAFAANAFSHATLRRAKTHLHIACTWSPDWSAWFWSLPDDPTPIPRLAQALQNEMSTSPYLSTASSKASKGNHL